MAHTNAEHPALVRRVIRGDPQGQRPAVSLLNLYDPEYFVVSVDSACYNSKMLSSFIDSKLSRASYKILRDKTYFGEIKGLRGIWANAKTLEKCRAELKEVLEDWLILKIRSGDTIPGFRLDVDRRKAAAYA